MTDSALTSRVKSARKAIGDSGKAQRFIKTIHGKGFRFVADASSYDTFADSSAPELITEIARLRWLLVIARALIWRAEWIRFSPESSGKSSYFLHVCACCRL